MKLRINDNSIRLRLSQKEVARFANDGELESFLDFAGGRFAYRISADAAALTPRADLHNNVIDIIVPEEAVSEWAKSDELTIEGGDTVKISVEKDLACRHRTESDDDAFPNPRAQGAI